ncbi:LysO family transporter [Photobacterium leiognathi]|uniref:LysO family transporter n=1 Tax=Photobacterium leiognathi TaxID=553611 RepID=UPI0027342191|nr:LysO family transporter [Photobacterium leiognathi]
MKCLHLCWIPLVIHRYPNTAIGYAGATAMDFTLPVIQKHKVVFVVYRLQLSVVLFFESLLVPVFILFFLSL